MSEKERFAYHKFIKGVAEKTRMCTFQYVSYPFAPLLLEERSHLQKVTQKVQMEPARDKV